jgi:cellulose synthase/poly-beta-1,6-N-acetylglucosamine synthase-like glycosyltransferase
VRGAAHEAREARERERPRKVFFVVLARDSRHVERKASELEGMGLPFVVICGEKVDHPKVVHREPRGKWDAINFGSMFVPDDADAVALNDVDTEVHGLEHALSHLEEADLVYCRVGVTGGPQAKFYRIADPIRRRLHVFASGELMIMRRDVFEKVLPIPPCIAEDSYILFKALELGYRARFCTKAYTTTRRTESAEEEAAYKARTTLGIYQALKYARPPPWIRAFYGLLPLLAPLLAVAGEEGRAWARGVMRALSMALKEHYPTKF